ncbi:MAG TPA: L,D-transpeptidase [Phycisphaerae bacterium]|nr:L,D-transpeptidase [Phycisphaerae bacterium]
MKRRIAAFFIVSIIALWLDFTFLRSPPEPEPVRVPTVGFPLPIDMATALDAAGWPDYAGKSLGLWVSVARQELIGMEDSCVQFVYRCSTAARGTGNKENSYQTPLGWHEIAERIGDGLPRGSIFNERKYTGKVWTPDSPTTKDLVLTRILWLSGLEPGVNKGPGIDSHARYIYIHGTPAEEKLGTPASWGCVRLSNRDVIDLFERVPSGTRVLITEW